MRPARRAGIALVAVLALSACGADDPAPASHLVIATGGQGGVYYTLGHAYAEAAHKRWSMAIEVRATAAAVENIRLIAERKADIAFATVDAAALATEGDPPFTAEVPLVALAGLYDDYLQIVVRADSRFQSVADLRGARVSTGSPNSGTEIVTGRVLAAAGLNENTDIQRRRMSAAGSATALLRGEIDAFFFSGGLPTPAVDDLSHKLRIRLLPVEKEMNTLQNVYGDFYLARSIPASIYRLDREVATLGIANVLLARQDLPEDTAYALTKLLFEAKPELAAAHIEGRRLDRRAALGTYPVPLHPGAARYYREAKSMVLPALPTFPVDQGLARR